MPYGDDERRLRGRGVLQVQVGVRVRHEKTDNCDAADVEEQYANVDAADGLWDVAARVSCFTTSDGDNLCANEGESGLGHYSPPCQESALASFNAVELVEGSWVLPVAEANTVVVGTSTKVKYNAEDYQTSDGDNFDRSKYEFGFAVCTCKICLARR